MRVAVVHSFYHPRVPSGENAVVRDQVAALRSAGHDVLLVRQDTEEREGRLLYRLESAATAASHRGRSPVRELRRFRPDVVHVHNTFPNFGRSWVNRWPGPLVSTLHNFRPLCAAATLYRDGHNCTDCLDGDRWAGLRHRCYRNSYASTLPLSIASARGVRRDPLLTRSDALIVFSASAKQHYVDAGVDPSLPVVGRNFLPDALVPARLTLDSGHSWLFVGRLSDEKGILELLRRWPKGAQLDIVGDGPLADRVNEAASMSIRLLGNVGRDEVLRHMSKATGLVFPSRCLEGAPLVYLEALASGLPVLAWDTNVVAEHVRTHRVGAVATWDDELPPVLEEAARRFPGLRGHCREQFDQFYSEAAFIDDLIQIYERAAARRRSPASTV